ncbi:hypothetical protein GCM10010472_20240 [Pseudonocardia halophobica]|uniref:HTH marR-type domain-containing protein n=1 Tax=Pseudonocardia halophobica TaxID=29401 RepID=A0A9W6NUN0_9PSEU|nr:MarR family transcriptional regulator [Pseudonocardia halophobica]GLL09763.1 hypothetical protein GCM10017577_09030 [Pseudonocardia halophobica]
MTDRESRRWTSVREYRSLLREQHEKQRLLDSDSIDRSELIFNLTRLINRLGQDFEALHRSSKWTWAGFRIMNVLWVAGPVELRDIARLSGASRATIWSGLQTLERDGLVTRSRDTHDRRLVIVSLTEAGRSALAEGIQLQAAREEQWLSLLSAEELDTLRALLEQIADREMDEPSSGR